MDDLKLKKIRNLYIFMDNHASNKCHNLNCGLALLNLLGN